jgi:hypothetical protein
LLHGYQQFASYDLQTSFPKDSKNLPTYYASEDFATKFCSSAQFLVFPVFSLQRFLSTTLPLAYTDTLGYAGTQSGATSARACVRAILLVGDVLGHNAAEVDAPVLQEYVREIEEALPIILREMTTDGFEALTMMVSTPMIIALHSMKSTIVLIRKRLYTNTSLATSTQHRF